MANPRRIQRLQKVILHTVAEHIQRELDDPRIGMVSVTRVRLSPDLGRCRIYWSCLGTESDRRTTERGLTDALASIQRAVAHAMQTRITPRLALQYDETLEQAERLETIFSKLRAERGEAPDAADAGGDDIPEDAVPEDAVPEDAASDDSPSDDALSDDATSGDAPSDDAEGTSRNRDRDRGEGDPAPA